MAAGDDDTGLTRGERLALLALGVLLVVITAVVVDRTAMDRSGAVVSPDRWPTPEPQIDLPISLGDAQAMADAWAMEWDPSADLILVSSRFERTGDEPAGTPSAESGMFAFGYVGDRDGDEWPRASVLIGRATGEIYFEDETASEAEPPPSIDVDLGTLAVTAEQAYRIAESVVGEGYRESCPEPRREVAVNLDATTEGELAWVVVYFDARDPFANDVTVRVDATTGDVETETRGDTSCDAP